MLYALIDVFHSQSYCSGHTLYHKPPHEAGLTERMWAGATHTYNKHFHLDRLYTKTSSIVDVQLKNSRQLDKFVLVTERSMFHEADCDNCVEETALMTQERSLLYCDPVKLAQKKEKSTPETYQHTNTQHILRVNELQLLRYSFR